jgi:hypothetical protein
MLSPQEVIGQKVWLNVQTDSALPENETYRVKAEISQPTSPPWFFARYLEAPPYISASGQWMSLYEAQLAILEDPVTELEEDYYLEEDYEDEDEWNLSPERPR